ncbi:hypothetical protein Xen7305DRAFT_00053200 [Xenococcus sp. PCC 7305]|nr:hypothetical protein Xen7305DRAFT_00053200 [Xenococcus sp. PCC 7305]
MKLLRIYANFQLIKNNLPGNCELVIKSTLYLDDIT